MTSRSKKLKTKQVIHRLAKPPPTIVLEGEADDSDDGPADDIVHPEAAVDNIAASEAAHAEQIVDDQDTTMTEADGAITASPHDADPRALPG